MQLETFLRKRELSAEPKKFRGLCLACFHPHLTCCCKHIERFNPKIRFAILIHVREAQKRIATGRLSHLCLENSLLINGYDYSENASVNALLADPSLYPVVLYPGDASANLSEQSAEERKNLCPAGRELLVFVIDGTWTSARKIVQRSRNLRELPRISFTPPQPSRFRLRRQPKEHCFSTVEAIHHAIELLGESRGFDTASRAHDVLLRVFDVMVEQQLELASRHKPRYLGSS
jgi:DTW domain-containing protein YfiP